LERKSVAVEGVALEGEEYAPLGTTAAVGGHVGVF
jgi:hypothetical protein